MAGAAIPTDVDEAAALLRTEVTGRRLKITHRGKFTITAIPGKWSTMTLSWAPTDGACGDSSYLVFGDPQL